MARDIPQVEEVWKINIYNYKFDQRLVYLEILNFASIFLENMAL